MAALAPPQIPQGHCLPTNSPAPFFQEESPSIGTFQSYTLTSGGMGKQSAAYVGAPASALNDITNSPVAKIHAQAPEFIPASVAPILKSSLAECSLSEITSGTASPKDDLSPRLCLDTSLGLEQSRIPGSPRQKAREAMSELGIDCSWNDSDDFYMCTYKVMMCPKKFSHEWSACPFAHKGERATRRDPRQVPYSATSCPDFKSGICPRGDNCLFSHGVFEACLHPERYRTQLCNQGANCKRSVCFFAHSLEELRNPAPVTCQPCTSARSLIAPQNQSTTPAPLQLPQAQSALVQQLLGSPLAADQTQQALNILSSQHQKSSAQATADPLLMAQLLTCQQALGTLSTMLNTSAQPQQQQGTSVADLLAQMQQQTAISALLPQQDQHSQAPLLQVSNLPVGNWLKPPANASSRRVSYTNDVPSTACGGQYIPSTPESLSHYLDSQLKISDMSPRTPFDMPPASTTTSVSEDQSPSHDTSYTSWGSTSPRETVPTTADAYQAFVKISAVGIDTSSRPEDHLPATLIDSIW